MTYDITPPAEGHVTLNLTWRDAEVLTRIIGLTNAGNLMSFSPELHEFVQEGIKHFGRNTNAEASRVYARASNGQIYLSDVEED